MARLAEEDREKQREIGSRIAEAREARRLTQPVVADRVHVTLRAYQNWEAGSTRVSWTNLPKLAEVLGTTEDYILHGHEPAAEPAEIPTPLQVELAEINRKLDRLLKIIDRPELEQLLNDPATDQALADLRARTAPPQPARRANRRSA